MAANVPSWQNLGPRFRNGSCPENLRSFFNLDLAQDFPNKILFHFYGQKYSSEIFRWPEMCPLGKILAQDFEMAAVTKILGLRDESIAPLLSTKNLETVQTKTHTACMVITYSKSIDQPGMVANPASGQLNRENEGFLVRVRA